MTRRQKQTLAVMAIVMLLVLGAIAFSFYQRDYNIKMKDFQAQLDGMATEASR